MFQGWWKAFSLLAALAPGAAGASPSYPAPLINKNSLFIRHRAVALSYNRAHKQADWVFYGLGAPELRSCFGRLGSFRPDPSLAPRDSAQLADYSGSGFDRGHLRPAGDSKWSQDAMRDSFLLSNVSPQLRAFNRGIWERLETLVRAWATSAEGGLWVTTGPLLSAPLPTIGAGKVAVPEYFYKVLATRGPGKHEAIAFLLPVDAHAGLARYEMTVRRLEEITGLNFLSGLDDEEEAEERLDPARWDLEAKFSHLPCEGTPKDWKWLSAPGTR